MLWAMSFFLERVSTHLVTIFSSKRHLYSTKQFIESVASTLITLPAYSKKISPPEAGSNYIDSYTGRDHLFGF